MTVIGPKLATFLLVESTYELALSVAKRPCSAVACPLATVGVWEAFDELFCLCSHLG